MNDRELEYQGDEFGDLEDRLSRALERVDPPLGFSERLMNRLGAEARSRDPRPVRLLAWPARAWAMASLLLVVAAVWAARELEVRRGQAEVARIASEFQTAVQVTNRTLDQARAQLERSRLGLWSQPSPDHPESREEQDAHSR